MRYAISACLMKENCKYNGGNNACEELCAFMQDKDYIKICPEVLGGLPVPRASCEIIEGRVINTLHKDCTAQFELGAAMAIKAIQDNHVDLVILQPRSPSCGLGKIYDGSFQGKLIEGNGVFANMLEEEGITGICVDDFIASIQKKNEKW